jgi:hypothetical protein
MISFKQRNPVIPVNSDEPILTDVLLLTIWKVKYFFVFSVPHVNRSITDYAIFGGMRVQGNEMYIRPAELYLFDREELCFYEVMVRARQRNEVVIGYRLATMDHAVINPPNKNVRIAWTIFDIFIVLSEEE